MSKVHVKTGDTVVVINGKYRGAKGKVMAVSPSEGKVIVEKVNVVKKHVKPRKMGEQGGIIEAEAAQGNAAAQEYLASVLQDPEAILRLFKLGNARNRWKILKGLNQDDLSYLLPFLETKDLVAGLQFFTQDALLKFIREMPKKEITKILFECFHGNKFP